VGTIFGQGGKTESAKVGNAKYRSSLELERFFVPKRSVLQKKRSSLDGSGFKSQGDKSRPGRAKISSGGQPPFPPNSRAYMRIVE